MESVMTGSPIVSIIIVVRNGVEVTRKCLEGLTKIKRKQVIIIDNASAPEMKKFLKSWKKYPIECIYNRQNNGFAEANNQGFLRAKAPYIVFLNNDTIITEDFFSPCKKYLDTHNSVGAVQPMILFPDGTIDSIGSYLTRTGFLYHRAHRLKPNRKFVHTESVYTLKGACMIWKRQVLEEIGILDEEYFAYFEETELCHRAWNAGYEVAVVPTSSITHLGGFTSNAMDQGFVQYHNTKNRICTYIRHLSLLPLCLVLPVHLIFTEIVIFRTFLTQRSVSISMQKGVLRGIIMGFTKRFCTSQDHRSVPYKNPDLSYYLALFSSLQGYKKVW